MRIASALSMLAVAFALLSGSDAWAQTAPSDNPGAANSRAPSAFSQVAAQSGRRRPASDGPEFGAKVGFVRPSESSGSITSGRPHGWEGGLFISSNHVERFGFMSELLLKQRGLSKAETTYLASGGKFADGYYSIQVPLLLRANFPISEGDGPVVFAAAGPAVEAWFFSLKDRVYNFSPEKEYRTRLDFALAGSLGIEVSRFTLEVRLNRGLRNTYDYARSEASLKTRSFAILGGFRFN